NRDGLGAQQILEQATVADDDFVDAHMGLAGIYGAAGQRDAAIEPVPRVAPKNPNQQQALNDLAYFLATEKAKPEEALTFAKRAYGLPNAGADVADARAWVYHLLGQNAEAEPLVTDAAKQRPDSAEIHWHAAAIL